MYYILNSAVITSPGSYRYRLGTVEEAQEFLCQEPRPITTIGYEETAQALSRLTGLPVAVNRRQIAMEPGDRALVFRLVFPPGTPRIGKDDKGHLTPEYVERHCEIGFLERLE